MTTRCNCDIELRGPRGCKGATGIQGLKGEQGIQGLKGEQGIQGLKGDTGPSGGEKGEQGLKGDPGLKGDTGPTGPPGLRGYTGPIGATGLKGETGLKGDTSLRGATGAIGATGPIGATGLRGPMGLKGDKGPSGGEKGDIGPPGPQGLKGDTGPMNTVVDCSNDSRLFTSGYISHKLTTPKLWSDFPNFATILFETVSDTFKSNEFLKYDDNTLGIYSGFGITVNFRLYFVIDSIKPVTFFARLVFNGGVIMKESSSSSNRICTLNGSFNTRGQIIDNNITFFSTDTINLQLKYTSSDVAIKPLNLTNISFDFEFVPTKYVPIIRNPFFKLPNLKNLVHFWPMSSMEASTPDKDMIIDYYYYIEGQIDNNDQTNLVSFTPDNILSSSGDNILSSSGELSAKPYNCRLLVWDDINYIEKYVLQGENKGLTISFQFKMDEFRMEESLSTSNKKDNIFSFSPYVENIDKADNTIGTAFFGCGKSGLEIYLVYYSETDEKSFVYIKSANSLIQLWQRLSLTFEKKDDSSIFLQIFINDTLILSQTYKENTASYKRVTTKLTSFIVGPYYDPTSAIKNLAIWDKCFSTSDILVLNNGTVNNSGLAYATAVARLSGPSKYSALEEYWQNSDNTNGLIEHWTFSGGSLREIIKNKKPPLFEKGTQMYKTTANRFAVSESIFFTGEPKDSIISNYVLTSGLNVIPGQFAISFWFRFMGAMPVDTQLFYISSWTQSLYLYTGMSTLNLYVSNDASDEREHNSISYSKPNNWCNVTINLRNTTIEWFLDGVQQNKPETGVSYNDWFTVDWDSSYDLGITPGWKEELFMISDFRIWNRCLDSTTIQELLEL